MIRPTSSTSPTPAVPDQPTPLGLPVDWPLVQLYGRSKHYYESAEEKQKKQRLKRRGTPAPSLTPIRSHRLAKGYLDAGANLGLLTGPRSRIAVIDNDNPDLFAQMETALGPLVRFVDSGRGDGRGHYYVRWYPGMPRTIWWTDVRTGKREKVGEILGDKAYAVIPPSIHPDTGRPYAWTEGVVLVLDTIPDLLQTWRDYLAAQPENQPVRANHPIPTTTLPTDEYARRRALALAGGGKVRQTSGNVKFQCPRCADQDKHNDNAVLFPNGIVACYTKIPEHNVELRKLFGIRAGTRPDADPWIQAQAERIILDLITTCLTGPGGITDTATLITHAGIVYHLGSWTYGASERFVMEETGISSRRAVQASHRRHLRSGRLERTAKGTRAGIGARWRLVPHRYDVSSGDQSHPRDRNRTVQETTGLLRKHPVAIDQILTILAHDVFRNRVGLGKGCALVYLRLVVAGPPGVSRRAFGPARRATIWKQFARLRAFDLARRDRSTGHWVVGPAALDRVVKRLKADGRRATQELQHAFERDTWLADSEGKITRLPSSTRPKRPRRPTKPTPPLAPTLQSVVDHLRAQGPRARRNHNSPSRRGQ